MSTSPSLTPLELKSAIVRNPLIVKPETTVMAAIALMSGMRVICATTTTVDGRLDELHLEARSSCVFVVEDERLQGIFTERDVVRLSAQQQPLDSLTLREVMVYPVITLHEEDFTDLLSAINLLQQYRIRHIPILDSQDRLVGLVTNESLRQTSRPSDLLRLRLVSEVMTSQVICALSNSSMLAIAQLMAQHGISSVMIVQTRDRQTEPLQIPMGIVTERDIVQFQALGLNLATCLAEAVMSKPIFAVKPDDSLWLVQQIMEQRLIRRLAVTGTQGELLGIVTQTSLLQALNPLEIYKLAEELEEKVEQLEAEKIALLQNRTIELEQEVATRTIALNTKAEREKLVAAIASQIRSSLSLQTILETTAIQVRQLLNCDRVNIWGFEADGRAVVVAESTESELSLLGAHVNDTCFQKEKAEIYRQGGIRVVHDIYTDKMSDCHREMLINLQTRAKIIVALLCGDRLWGLLNASESQHSRQWQPEEVELLQTLSVHLAIAIQQATTHQKLQEELIERQQIEARLRESEQRYMTLAAAAPVGIFRTDAKGNCIYANDRWCQIAGLTPEAAPGEGWRQGLHPEDRQAIATEWYQSAQEQRPFSLEYRFQRPDGTVTWVYGQSVAEQNSQGQVIGYVGTITDISDRKQAEDALQRLNQDLEAQVAQRTKDLQASEATNRATLETIPDLLLRLSRDGTCLDYIKSEVGAENFLPVVNHIAEILPPDLLKKQLATIEQAIATRKLQVYEHQFLKHDRRIYEEVRILAINDDQVLAIIRDISDRKLAETQLQKISERLALALKSGAIGCWEWDIASNTILWDERMYELYGVTKQSDAQVVYDIWAKGLHPDDRLPTETLLQQTVLGQAEYDTEFRVVHPDGSIHFIKAFGMVVPDEQGNPQSVIGVNFDITEQQAALRERKQAELALQSSEIRFRRVFDSSIVGMIFADFQGRITEANDRFLEMVGYTRQDLDNGAIHWDAMTPPEYVPADLAAMEYLMEHGAIAPWEKEYYRKDGSRIPILIGAAILPGSEDQTICVLVDISKQQAALRERQRAETIIRQQAEREKLLREITQRIRQSLDLQTIFDTACQEIRQVIQADRVGIFKFYPDSNFDDGEFVAESVVEGFPSVVAIRVHDHCFGENYSSLYAKGRSFVVNDIYHSGMTACHTHILAQFHVRANLIMPLLCGDQLWGLLCVHQCATPRHWQQFEIDFIQQLANQLAIAIQQANLYEQIQSELLVRQQAETKIALQLRRQQTLGAIVQQIRDSLDINQILTTVTQQVKEVLNGDRVIVFRLFPDGKSRIVEEAVSEEFPILKNLHWDDEVWSPEILNCYWQGQPRIVPDVMNDIWTDCLIEYSLEGEIRSKIIAPILQEVRKEENHRWVAPSENNKLWGVLVVHACGEKRVWKNSEAQLLQQIANQLAIAIQQANLFEQLQEELTERHQAEVNLTKSNQQLAISNQELARATRLKDEFLANMSHELRTPLNAILGMTEGLQDEVFGIINERQIKALQTIQRSGSHLLALINDILDLAKIESGEVKLDFTSMSVVHLCQSSLTFINQQALQKQIQIHTNFPPHLPSLLVDERRIRQVLINLLNNAVKFTPEGGKITLEVTQLSPPQNFLRFAVIDTGIGISPENIQKLFQPFIQIDSALNRQYAGTGLGLALVKRIVELHGGKVGLSSELGVGSCFTIELPYTSSSSLSPPIPGEEIDSPSTQAAANQSPLILLAEDNEANISMLVSYLEAKGYQMLLANNGREAIDLAKIHRPDLILMDIQMPVMDGLEAMQQIRLDPNLVNIPMVALTAIAMIGDREKCLAAGANDYLSKPIKLKQLTTTIQQLLTQKSSS